jgi:hypothetical protein
VTKGKGHVSLTPKLRPQTSGNILLSTQTVSSLSLTLLYNNHSFLPCDFFQASLILAISPLPVSFIPRNKTSLKRLAVDKNCSLFRGSVSDKEENVCNIETWQRGVESAWSFYAFLHLVGRNALVIFAAGLGNQLVSVLKTLFVLRKRLPGERRSCVCP